MSTRLVVPLVFVISQALLIGCSSSGGDGEVPESTASIAPKIVGGTLSPSSQDFVFILTNMVDPEGLQCSATLIAPNVALTARHCVSPESTTRYPCAAGGASNNPRGFGASFPASHFTLSKDIFVEHVYDAKVTKVFTHDGENVCGGKDIAILLLDGPLGPDPATIRETPAIKGETFTVVGDGRESSTTTESSPQRLQRTGVEVLEVGPAAPSIDGGKPIVVPDGDFLASIGFCQGDSGGPALDADGKVIGLVSRLASATCEVGPDLYTGLIPSLDMIHSALIEGGNDPNPPSDNDAGADDGGQAAAPAASDSSGCSASSAPSRGAGWAGLALFTWAAALCARRRRGHTP